MIVYKLFRVLATGELTSLFIDKTTRLPLDLMMQAEEHPTKGYKFRPYWHCTATPKAPHLSDVGRAWYKVEIEDYEVMDRPEHQGGTWYLASRMRIIEEVI